MKKRSFLLITLISLALTAAPALATDRDLPGTDGQGGVSRGGPGAGIAHYVRNIRASERAVANWRRAFATGDFEPLINQLDDTVQARFALPAPYNVTLTDKASVVQALNFAQGLHIRVIQTPVTPPMYNGYSVTFEFVAKGTVGANAVQVPLLAVFDILNGRIVAIREYVVPQ